MISSGNEGIDLLKIRSLKALTICADIAQEHMGSSSAATGKRQRELRDLKVQLTGSIFAGIGSELMERLKLLESSSTPETKKGS